MLSYWERTKSKKERMLETEQELYFNIVKYMKEKKCSPTVRELKVMMRMNSTSTTLAYLKRLKEKNMINWMPKTPRSIQIIEQRNDSAV